MKRRRVAVVVVQAAGAVAVTAAAAGLAVPAAWAGDEWCDTDPLLVLRTPAGNLVPVYCSIGVYGPAALVAGLVASLTPTSTAAAVGGRTRATVTATVSCGPGAGYPTRLTVSSLPFGTGTVYGQTTGTCGESMAVSFFLAVP